MLQKVHDQCHKQVGGLAGLVFFQEIGFDSILFHAAEGWIGDDDIDPIFWRIALQRFRQGVVMPDIGRHIDIVEHHVGHGQHVRQRFFLDAVDTGLQGVAIFGGFDLLFQMFDGAGEKTAGTAGGVKNGIAEFWIECVDHKLGHSPGRVVFTGVAGRLQIG